MPPITLKVASNAPFHNIDSVNELRETWKVCTKVKDSLENGSRLENLSWRLWYVHNNNNSNSQEMAMINQGTESDKANLIKSNESTEKTITVENKGQQQLQPPAPSPPLEPPSLEPLTAAIQQQIEYRRMLRRQQHEQLRQKITIKQDYDQSCDEQQLHQQQVERDSVRGGVESTICNNHPTTTTILPNMPWQQHQQLEQEQQEQQQQQQQQQQPETMTLFKSSTPAIYYNNTNKKNDTGIQINGTTPVQSAPKNNPVIYTAVQPSPTPITLQQSIQDHLFNDAPSTAMDVVGPILSCEQAYNESSWDFLTDSNPVAASTTTGFYVSSAIPSPVPNSSLYSKLLSTLPRETLESVEKLLMPQTYSLQDQVPGSMMTSIPQNDVGVASYAVHPHSFFNLSLIPTITEHQQQHPSPIITTTNNASLASSLKDSSASAPSSPIRKSSNKNSNKTKNSVKKKISNHVYVSTLHFPSSATQQEQKTYSSYRHHHPKSTVITKNVRRSLPVKSSSVSEQGQSPVCSNCSTTQTPLWRRSCDDELLCNACGLYLKLHNAPRPKHLKPHSGRKDGRGGSDHVEDGFQQPVCSNCGTSMTPLWRRDNQRQPLCNACGLYLKLHNQRRPLSLKSDTIKKRQRVENSEMVTPTATAASTTRRPAKKTKIRVTSNNNDYSTTSIIQHLPTGSSTPTSSQQLYYKQFS